MVAWTPRRAVPIAQPLHCECKGMIRNERCARTLLCNTPAGDP
jgi:hypothetical protein